jgi:hypothetical protein
VEAAITMATPKVIARAVKILRNGWAVRVRQTRSLVERMVPLQLDKTVSEPNNPVGEFGRPGIVSYHDDGLLLFVAGAAK